MAAETFSPSIYHYKRALNPSKSPSSVSDLPIANMHHWRAHVGAVVSTYLLFVFFVGSLTAAANPGETIPLEDYIIKTITIFVSITFKGRYIIDSLV